MRGGWPPDRSMAIPVLADQIPRVTMNEGTRKRVTTNPLTRPNSTPTTIPSTIPKTPKSRLVRLFITVNANVSELAAMTPSIERSIEPWMMTKVIPVATIVGIAARLAIVCRLSIVAKLGSAMPNPRQRMARAITGPHKRTLSMTVPRKDG